MKKLLTIILCLSVLLPSVSSASIAGVATSNDIKNLQTQIITIAKQVIEIYNKVLGTPVFGASFTPVQAQKTYLFGAGIIATDTSIKLTSLKLPNGTVLNMSNFGDKGFSTIEPATTKEENISFTGLTQNGDGTALLTGVSRGLSFVAPYLSSTTLSYAHAGGSPIILSNSSAFYNQFAIANNTTTINGNWTFTSSSIPQAASDTTAGQFAGNGGMNFINYNTLASTSFSGTVNADASTKGIVQFATALQTQSSTVQGSTGAFLAVPNSLVSATSTASGTIPATGINNKLNQVFLNLNESFSFASGTSFASSTMTGTTTLRATVDFTSSTVVGLGYSQLLDATSTAVSSLSSVATTTLARLNVPANTLRGVNTIRGTFYLSNVTNVSTNDNIKVNMSYGDTATTSAIITFTGTAQQGKGRIYFTLSAGGTTNAQFGNLGFETWQQAPGASSTMASNNAAGTSQTNSTWAVDATAARQLVISTTNSQSNAALGIQVTSYIVEKILNL